MKRLLIAACTVGACSMSQAITLDADGQFQLTGFYELTAGKVLSGESKQFNSQSWAYQQWHCPCSIQNWEYVGVYEKSRGWQADLESLFGLQLNAHVAPALSVTAQMVVRPKNHESGDWVPTLDWAYASWQLNDEWSLQAGRKRIPLYYYSDYLYVGYAYPWVRPSADVYGWPIFTYDGVTALYTRQLGNTDWTLNASAWTGQSGESKKNAYNTLIYYGTPEVHEQWDRINGGWVALSNGIVEGRLMMMTHEETTIQPGGWEVVNDHVFTRLMAASLNVDYHNVVLRSELNQFQQRPHEATRFVYDYFLLGAGYKVGTLLPMVTLSRYAVAPNTLVPREGHRTMAYSLRWDFAKNTALKVEYDVGQDKSEYSYPFFGDSKLLSVSLQGTF